MAVKLSVAIMAHQKRRHLIPTLCDRLGVSQDVVVWDQFNDRWDTGRRSLLAYQNTPAATHHMVIQDDAVPAKDLIAATEAWLPRLPESILCLYAGRVRDFRVNLTRHRPPKPSWLQMKKINWGVALVFPVQHIRSIVAHGDTRVEMENYDMRMSEWCVANNMPVIYPYPSWVNHETTPSLVPGRGAHRKAVISLNANQSALRWARGNPPIIQFPDFVRQSELGYPLLSDAKLLAIPTNGSSRAGIQQPASRGRAGRVPGPYRR